MNADGSNLQGLRNDTVNGWTPDWSPDGQRIVYTDFNDGEIHVINADGTGDTRLTFIPARDLEPAWSPDGAKIAFASERDGNAEIYVMDADGTDQTRLTTKAVPDRGPNWSPNGSRIAFGHAGDIWTMNADGTGMTRITSIGFSDSPAWSPDGSKIVFESSASGYPQIYVVNADGTNVTLLDAGFCSHDPDWQPIIRGYARPKGASPMRIPLVPAAKPCTAPNSTHGSPLSFGSCSPGSTTSSNLVVSFGEQRTKSIGQVTLKVVPGTAGAPDDADVTFDASTTNVMRASDHADYTGELRLELPLRITDRWNFPNPGGNGYGTVSDTSLYATIPCTASADTTLGASCALSSTIDALVPGAVQEGLRAVWALGQLKLHDGGADGDADTPADNELFEVEGIFVP
jgi:dipeptidyl aminopeptidase/acylaminoacyl peptidase